MVGDDRAAKSLVLCNDSMNLFAVNVAKPVNTNQLVVVQSIGHQNGAHGSPGIVYSRFGH